jgi:CubicO group peptidase (beta-lactamase class C family)
MFEAVATLQLVETGRLRLDDVVGKHIPEYENKKNRLEGLLRDARRAGI